MTDDIMTKSYFPFKSDEFKETWDEFCTNYLEQKGKALTEIKKKYILLFLVKKYKTDLHAIKALAHHILMDDFPTYTLNFVDYKKDNDVRDDNFELYT